MVYKLILQHLMCYGVGLNFTSDVDTEFGSDVGGVFEVRVKDEVISKNGRHVNNDGKYEVVLEFGDSYDWVIVEIYIIAKKFI